jgi:hypothetical protein
MVCFNGLDVVSNLRITEPDTKAITLARMQNYARDIFLYERMPAASEVSHV